ncbi:uncharacterized protein LOC119739788 [Patiria miniata]|uniref:Uncharacterized protein n=1 Tax=Patiria miniata TaxID=46514 RepID=A0A914B390_PATMI|nr:uncharacterized protein LOC119739788 [Patiria miniata]
MSATVEINALSAGSGGIKYEVNSNIVPDLSAAGDCSAGTPGKYRPLRAQQPPPCTAAGDPPPCERQTLEIADPNANEKTDNDYDTKQEVAVIDLGEENSGNVQVERDDLLKNGNSVEFADDGTQSRNKDSQSQPGSPVCQDASNDVNSDKGHVSSELDGVDERLEAPGLTMEVLETSASEINEQEHSENNSSPQDEEQEEVGALKQKSKKRGGILQAVQLHLPKFGKRGHIGSKGREGSASSGPESSPEKHSRKNKKRDKHGKQAEDEDGDVAMANGDHDNEGAKIEEGCQTPDFEQDKSDLVEGDPEKMSGSSQDENRNVAIATDDTVAGCPVEDQDDQMDEGAEDDTSKHQGHVATPEPEELVSGNIDAVAKVTEKNEEDGVAEHGDTEEIATGPTDNEPSSIPNSSLASGDDFYTLPQSSLGSSTEPYSSEMSEGGCEDSSTTKQDDSSTLGGGEDSSVLAEASTKSLGDTEESLFKVDGDSVKTDTSLQKPDVIPDDEVVDSEPLPETSVPSSANQSSFDTDSPSLTGTPEQSPKKKSKRRVPILNVPLPSFGKKHHRSAKSPEQSSDSDRSSSPSKKFSWKRKSPRKAVAVSPTAAGSGSTEEEMPKQADSGPIEKTEAEALEEKHHSANVETDLNVDVSADIPADLSVAGDYPERREEALASTEKEKEGEVSHDENEDAGQEHNFPENKEVDDLQDSGSEKEDTSAALNEVSGRGGDAVEEEFEYQEQPRENESQHEMEVSVSFNAEAFSMPPSMQEQSRCESEEIASDGREEAEDALEDDLQKDAEKTPVPEDDTIDAEDDEAHEMAPGFKLEGKIHMSASLEVHASPTHHVSSPADFIYTNKSVETGEDEEVADVETPDVPQGGVNGELTAAEKILAECNQLVADDSVGDVQFTPDMLSEFTNTINAFEDKEEREDFGKGGDEEKEGDEKVEEGETEGLEMNHGEEEEALNVEGENSFGVHIEAGMSGPAFTNVAESVPVDVGCQMTWEDEVGEDKVDQDGVAGVHGSNEILFGLSRELEVSEDADNRSVSSSTSSSSSSGSSTKGASGEIFVAGISLKEDETTADIKILDSASPDVAEVEVSTKAPSFEEINTALPDPESAQVSVEAELPKSINSTLSVDVPSSSIPEISPSVQDLSSDSSPGGGVQVVMNEEGSAEPDVEVPSITSPDVKQKTKSKGLFSGFNFHLPRLRVRGRRSGKLNVASKNDRPSVDEGTISFNVDKEREADDGIQAENPGISKASSELDISRRRSSGCNEEFVLDNKAPSVPDVSRRELALKRSKKKSFTLPNMHLRLPRFSVKKSLKSPTANKVSLPNPEEVNIECPSAESNPSLDGNVGIKVDVATVESCEAEVAVEGDLKATMPSSAQEKAVLEVQMPSLNTAEVEAPEAEANPSGSSSKEGSISVNVSCGKPQVDGLFIAVPAFVEGDSDPDESVPSLDGEGDLPEVTTNLETNDVDAKLQAWGMDISIPSVSDFQSDVDMKPGTNAADINVEADFPETQVEASVKCDVDVTKPACPAVDSDEAEFSGEPEESFPPDGLADAGTDLSCGIEGDVQVDVEKAEILHSPVDAVLSVGTPCNTNVEVELPEAGGVVEEADSLKKGSSEDIFVNDLNVKDCGDSEVVGVDLSTGLALSAGSGDASLENQVETGELSLQAESKASDVSDGQSKSPDQMNSPTKHRFKLPHLHFSLPKFGGLHSPTKKFSSKKSKMVISPSTEACAAGCEIPDGADKAEKVGEPVFNNTAKEVEETVPEPVLESDLQASFVKPEVDIGGDLELRLGGFERKEDEPFNIVKDDVRAKLDFDAEEIPPEFIMKIGNADCSVNGIEQDCNPSGLDDLDVRLADISFGAQVSPAYPNGDADKDDCECHVGTQSQEDPSSSVDLNWEDEMCSRVQVDAPKYKLSDIKGGLSLGVVVSEDGSAHSDIEEKVPEDETDGEVADVAELSVPEMPELAVNSPEECYPEITSSPQSGTPEVNLSVDATSAQRKQSTSSQASAKSTSSHNSQTNASELPKKKSGIIASLGLPKLHFKLPSPRSKSLDRHAADSRHPEVHPEATSSTLPAAGKSTKKPGGKRSKKGRWKPGKSSSKGKQRTGSGGSTEGTPKPASDVGISGNIRGDLEMDINGQPSWELDLNQQPSTSAGPVTSTPVRPTLSLNNSAQTPGSTNSLSMEQAVAIHSSPATPLAPSAPSPHPFKVVVAIDFGTTFSGYAYSYRRDPDDVQIMRKWEGGDPGVTNMKTPTTLLLHPGGEFHSFGFTARDFYHDMDHSEALRWLYFDKFKLALHKDPNLNLETELTAANGQRLPAIKVFEHALCFFRGHAMEELCDQSNDGRFDPGDIRWVLTVPAIWKQPAKQFMREAAYRAGIASPSFPEQLLIALEPEAASICIRKLRMRELVPEHLSQRRKWSAEKPEKSNSQVAENIRHGTRYMVVDCGGGTVDITVHEVEEDGGTLKELHKAAGGMYGSVSVDAEFEKLLVDIFGSDYIEEFKIKRPAGWVDLMIAFESRKRNVNPYKSNPLNVSLPFSFIDYYKKYTRETQTVEDAIWNYRSRDVTWSAQGMLRFSPEGMQQLFRPAVASIISLVEGLLNEPELKGVSYLFLAGGFAQSPLLQNQMRKKFASRLRVIIPRDVGLAILKGAVMFGLDPTAVRVRRSRLTYGVGVLNKFDPSKHPREKHVVKDGLEWCRDVFDTFVQSDQSVAVGDKVTRSYTPAKPNQKAIIINIYCTERDKVQFITDEGVQKCGTMHIDVSDAPSGDDAPSPKKRRELQLTMQYGDTEIKVSALDVPTGRCVKANIDFLSK